jgi:hypothetical protein
LPITPSKERGQPISVAKNGIGLSPATSDFVVAKMMKWCPETELNRRHADFQSAALPTELSGHRDQRVTAIGCAA